MALKDMNSAMPLHPWSTSISCNHQFFAAILQECRRKLWPSSRQSTYQGCGNLAQLTPSPWGSRGFGHGCILNCAATSHIQPPNTSWCTESNSRTSWRRLERPWKGWFAVAAVVCLYKLMIPTTSVRHSVGCFWDSRLWYITNPWHCFMIILHGMYSEYACCMFVFSYLAQTFCLFGMALI